MPQVAAAAVASWIAGASITSASAAAAAGLATAVAYTATYALTSAALTMGLTALTAPKVGGRTGSPQDWKAEDNPPIPFPIGRIGTGGYIVYRNTFGPDNRYQGIVTVVAGAGPINAWSSFTLDDVEYSQTGDKLNHPKFNNWAWRQTRLGAQPDTALTSPSGIEGGGSGLPGWTAAHKLSGKACDMLTLRQDADFKYFPQGEPRAMRVVQGLLAWDPRLDSTWPGGSGSCRLDDASTWVYSTNPLIHALKWALGMWENGKLVGGIGASVDAINVSAFIDAANIADLNGWTIGGVPTTADDKYQVITAMMQAGGAVYVRENGLISCISRGTPRVSLLTVTKDDLAGPVRIVTGASRIGRINTIVPRCVQEDQKWAMTQLGAVSDEDYVTEDGDHVRQRGVDYPYVTDAEQCAQLAALDIAKSREGITGTLPMKPYMRTLKPGDAFTITEADFVLDGLQVIVESRSYDPSTGIATVNFSSDTPGAVEWALGQAASPPPTPSLSPPDVTEFDAPEVGDWTATAGTGQPSILVAGAATNSQTQTIIVEYRKTGDTDWIVFTEVSGTVTLVEITGLEPATDYDVRVSYRSIWGVQSDPLELDPVTTVYIDGGGVEPGTIDGTHIADGSVTTPKFASGIEPVTVVSSVPGTKVTETIFNTTDGKVYVWRTGVYTRLTPTSDLLGTISSSQIANAAITTAKFASTIEPVTLVSSVPGSKSTETIFNTTDGKLYRWTGSAYSAAVPTSDLTGTISAAQIAAGAVTTAKFASGIEPVTVVSSVPGTKSTETIFNTANSKIYRWNGSAYVATVATTDLSGTVTDAQIAGLAASKITGTLTNSQIADLAAAKLTGTISTTQIADNAISTPKLAAGSVTTAKIDALAVTANEIATNAITSGKIFAGAVTTAKIAAGAVTATEIAAGAIVAGKIAAGTIVAADIAADTITAGQIAAGAISTSELAAGAITTAKIAAGAVTATEIAAGAVIAGKIAAGTIVAADIAADTITAGQIAAGAISTSELAAGAVTAAKIAAGTITATEIASLTITSGVIAAGAITTAKIAAGAVTATEIAADTITAGQIAAGAISTSELATGAITTAKLAAGAVTATEIASNAVTTAKLDAGAVTATKISVSSLDAISANLGTISVDTANITNLAVTNVKIGNLAVETGKIADDAVTYAGSSTATFPTTLTNSSTTGWLLRDITMTTVGGDVWLTFSMAWLITDQQELEFYVYVDTTYTGGATPTGYSYVIPVETSSGSDIQNNTSFSVLLTGLSAASHHFYVYARNNTGASVDIGVRTLVCVELKK